MANEKYQPNPSEDFKLSANFAKKLSMQGKGEKGEQARDYFITVEDKLKEIATKGIAHNVKQLTITSRDIAVMTTRKSLHGQVVCNIRECVAELSQMGFDTRELFIEDTYIGANKQENMQYLCTEKGCNCYANKLEPEARQKFISEFTERFENMRCIAEGKPMKKTPKLICMADVPEKEPLIKVFKNESGGIVLMDGDIYQLEPEELYMLSRFVPEIEKTNIGQIQYAISAFLKSMKGIGKLEQVASFGEKQDEPPKSEVKALPDKSVQNSLDLNSVENLTEEQAMARYNIGRTNLKEIANYIAANVRVGVKRLYNRRALDEYFSKPDIRFNTKLG